MIKNLMMSLMKMSKKTKKFLRLTLLNLTEMKKILSQVAKKPKERLSESLVLLGIAAALYDSATGWPKLRTAIAEVKKGKGDKFLALSDEYTGRTEEGDYTANEFDIGPLQRRSGAIMELGRSCVDISYRDRSTMQLLWRGIAEYVMAHRIEVMFGCGSLSGTDPNRHALALSYLYYNHLAPEDLRVKALPERYIEMRRVNPETIDARRALVALPPLLKGYLRAGAFIGDGAVIDKQFNTIDICVIVKTDLITGRYTRHYDLAQA